MHIRVGIFQHDEAIPPRMSTSNRTANMFDVGAREYRNNINISIKKKRIEHSTFPNSLEVHVVSFISGQVKTMPFGTIVFNKQVYKFIC